MAAKGDIFTRDIPITLHDGTILRKKRHQDQSKRFSEIIVDVNGDENWNTRDRTNSYSSELRFSINGASRPEKNSLQDLREGARGIYQRAEKLEQKMNTSSHYDARAKSPVPEVPDDKYSNTNKVRSSNHDNSSTEILNIQQNFGYVKKPQTKPGAIKPLIYYRNYGSAKHLLSADRRNEPTYQSENNICRGINKSEVDVKKETENILPITTVKGIQRRKKILEEEQPRLVNPFLDEDLLKKHSSANENNTHLDASENYWLHVTKDIGCKTVSRQQLNSMDAATQTIKGNKNCKVM